MSAYRALPAPPEGRWRWVRPPHASATKQASPPERGACLFYVGLAQGVCLVVWNRVCYFEPQD